MTTTGVLTLKDTIRVFHVSGNSSADEAVKAAIMAALADGAALIVRSDATTSGPTNDPRYPREGGR